MNENNANIVGIKSKIGMSKQYQWKANTLLKRMDGHVGR
jgi:hypothetical protein